MKKMIQGIKVSIFMGALIMPSLIWYGAKILTPDLYQEWDFDLGENRERELFPKISDIGSYIQELEDYYNDHLPFRSMLITQEQRLEGGLEETYARYLQANLSRLLYGDSDDTTMDISELIAGDDMAAETEMNAESGSEADRGTADEHDYVCTEEIAAACMEEGKKIYVCEDCGDSYTESIPAAGHDYAEIFRQEADYTNYGYTDYECSVCGESCRDDFVGKLIDNSYFAPKVVGEGVLLGRFDWLFYTGNDSVAYYRGTNLLDGEKMESYLELMQQLQELCDERGIQLQFMIVPDKEQIYPEYMPSYEIADTYKRVDRFVDYVRENSDINIIYPFQELKEAELYWQTYYQYDTHWNHIGAYVGTQALYDALGISTTSPHDVEITDQEAIRQDLIYLGGLDGSRYPADEDYFVDYKPEVEITFTKGDKMAAGIYYARSDADNEQNLVFLGDSFRCSMTDYLIKDFSYSVIAHRDYVDGLKESIRNADVLVISAIERQDNRIFPVIEKVIKILEEEE